MKKSINWVVKPVKKQFKLKKRDLKLLEIIRYNARLSFKEVGKKLHLSKVAVFNRIKNLEEKNVITGYSCFIDFNKLGFNTYQIGIKTNMNEEQKEAYIKRIGGSGFVNQILQLMSSKWDFLIRILSDDESFNKNLDALADQRIEKMDVLRIQKGFLMRDKNGGIEFISKSKQTLGKQDLDLLFELVQNSRQRIVDLASKLDVSTKSIIKNIKKLQKNKIVLSFPTEFNPFVYGEEGYLLLVTTKNRKVQDRLATILSRMNSPGVFTNFQSPNIISFHVFSSLDEVKQVKYAMKPFSNNINNYELARVEEQSFYTFFPQGVYDLLIKR